MQHLRPVDRLIVDVALDNMSDNYELVASIAAIDDRGQREVTCRAVPFRLP